MHVTQWLPAAAGIAWKAYDEIVDEPDIYPVPPLALHAAEGVMLSLTGAFLWQDVSFHVLCLAVSVNDRALRLWRGEEYQGAVDTWAWRVAEGAGLVLAVHRWREIATFATGPVAVAVTSLLVAGVAIEMAVTWTRPRKIAGRAVAVASLGLFYLLHLRTPHDCTPTSMFVASYFVTSIASLTYMEVSGC